MPPRASSNAPWRAVTAPVNAPFSWPNSSLSISVPATAPQSTTTNGLSGARRQLVERARDHLLAGAGLALDEHGRVGRRDPLEQAEDLAHRGRLADHLAERFLLGRQDLDALLERRELELGRADADHRAGAQVRLLDLGAVEERAVRALQVANEVALGVAHDLEVDARHGLVGEHEVVLGRLADADHVARDHELGAALRALDDDELAPAQVDRRRRRFAPDPRPRQVLHRWNRTMRRVALSRRSRRQCCARSGESRWRVAWRRARRSRSAVATRDSRRRRRRQAVGRAAAVVPRSDDRGPARRELKPRGVQKRNFLKRHKINLVAHGGLYGGDLTISQLDRRRLARLLLHRGLRHRRPSST